MVGFCFKEYERGYFVAYAQTGTFGRRRLLFFFRSRRGSKSSPPRGEEYLQRCAESAALHQETIMINNTTAALNTSLPVAVGISRHVNCCIVRTTSGFGLAAERIFRRPGARKNWAGSTRSPMTMRLFRSC